MLEEYEVSTEDARALCAKVLEAGRRPFGFWFRSSEIGAMKPKIDGHSDALDVDTY